MTFEEFNKSLSQADAPTGMTETLAAMWYAGKGDWEGAHNIAQDIPTRVGDWIHAYLHRWEGDQWNAKYWYRRAGKAVPQYSLEEEWKVITQTLTD